MFESLKSIFVKSYFSIGLFSKKSVYFLGEESSDGAKEWAKPDGAEKDTEKLDEGPEEGPHIQRVRISWAMHEIPSIFRSQSEATHVCTFPQFFPREKLMKVAKVK